MLPYANKKIREKNYSMNNAKRNTTQDMINKLQSLNGQRKIKFYENESDYYDETDIRKKRGKFLFEEDLFSKNAESISKIYREVLLLMKFLQTKPQVKSRNIFYCDLYYTVIQKKK